MLIHFFQFGRAFVGYVGHTDYAGFSHRDHHNTTSYGLLQGANGDTLVNAGSSSRYVYLRVVNSTKLQISNTDNYLLCRFCKW